MNKQEAREVLRGQLEPFRRRAYAELVQLIGEPQTVEVSGPSGATYQIEIEAMWDRNPQGDLMVIGSIDDGGWRAFVPLCESFIMSPSGALVGE